MQGMMFFPLLSTHGKGILLKAILTGTWEMLQLQNYFHEMAYPADNCNGQSQQTYCDSHFAQQQFSNISVVVSQCTDGLETKETCSTNNETCDICGKDDSSKNLEVKSNEESTAAYSDKAGYTTSDCEADTESLAGEADHLLTCTHTSLVKGNASSSDILPDSFDGTVTDNETISSTETVPDTKKRKCEVNTNTYQLQSQ